MHGHDNGVLCGFFAFAPVAVGLALFDGVAVDDDAAAFTFLAFGGKGFQQPGPELFAGHLDETKGGDFGDLVPGAVAPEGFGEAPEHEFLVCGQHHVDEVDDNHPA